MFLAKQASYSIKDRFSLDDLESINCKSFKINPIYSSYVFEIPHEINCQFLARVFLYLSERRAPELKEIEFKLYLTVVGRGRDNNNPGGFSGKTKYYCMGLIMC